MSTKNHTAVVHALLDKCVATRSGSAIAPQDVLSREMNCSRTLIREAIVILEFMGVITVRPKIGTVVNPAGQWGVVPRPFMEKVLAMREVETAMAERNLNTRVTETA